MGFLHDYSQIDVRAMTYAVPEETDGQGNETRPHVDGDGQEVGYGGRVAKLVMSMCLRHV